MTRPSTETAISALGQPMAVSVASALNKVEARGVTRSFHSKGRQVDALGPLDLDVPEGQFLCIVGPSGCGKSTFLRVVAGLVKPSAGTVTVRPRAADRTPMAMVFQEYSVLPWKSVRANVRLGLELNGTSRAEAESRVNHWLDAMGLADFAEAYPATLSGGMRQRVSIARALAVEPELLLMDEPFAALDAQLRAILQEELLRIWESDRRSVIFVTHSLEEALLLGDRVVVMSARPGAIIADHQVPFPRPRAATLRADRDFNALQQRIWDQLRDEVDRTFAAPSARKGRQSPETSRGRRP